MDTFIIHIANECDDWRAYRARSTAHALALYQNDHGGRDDLIVDRLVPQMVEGEIAAVRVYHWLDK